MICASSGVDRCPTPRSGREPGVRPRYSNRATPVVFDGVLYTSTPLNVIMALAAETGDELWRFDPGPWREESYFRGLEESPTGSVEQSVWFSAPPCHPKRGRVRRGYPGRRSMETIRRRQRLVDHQRRRRSRVCHRAIPFSSFVDTGPHIPRQPEDAWRFNLYRIGGKVNFQYSM